MDNWLLVWMLLVVSVTVFLSSLMLAFYRRTIYLKIFSGVYACFFASEVLLAFQSMNNTFLSSVISNVFLMAGYLLLFGAVRSFYMSKPVWARRFWVYLVLTFVVSFATAILSYNTILRNILLGSLTVAIFLDFGFYIFKRLNSMSSVIRNAMIISLLVNTVTNAVRPVLAVSILSPKDMPTSSGVLNMFVFTAYAVTSILWFATVILLDGSRMLEETRIGEEKYRSLIDSSDAAIMLVDPQGRFLFLNAIAAGPYGKKQEEMTGIDIRDIFPADQTQSILADIGQVIFSGQGIIKETCADIAGETRYFRTSIQPVRGESGTPYAVMISSSDISDIRNTQEELRKLSRAVEQSPVSIVITDIDGYIEYANPKASETTGYTIDELIGMNPHIQQPGDGLNEGYEKSWRNLTQGSQWNGIIHSRRKNGDLYWESTAISPLVDGHGKITHFIGIKEDITEKKKIEESLIENENRLAQVAEQSRTVIWEVDVEGKYTYISDVAEIVYGYSSGELNCRYIYEIVPPDTIQSFKVSCLEILQSGICLNNYERQVLRKDGTVIWVSTNGAPLFDDNNNIIGFRGADNDITGRKAAEDETRKFRAIADQANYGTAISTLDGELIYVNDAYAKMHGWEKEALVGKNLALLYNPEQNERVDMLLEPVKKAGGGFAAEEVWHTRKDGTHFPTLMSAKNIVDSGGKAIFMSATVIDITEMKQKEKEIQRLSVAIEQSPVAIVITDLQGYIEYVSPAFEVITGYKPDEVIGKHTRILNSGTTKPEVYHDMWDTILAGRIWKGEWINKKKDGELFFESVSINPVYDEEGRMTSFLAVKENITQRKKAEEALIKSEEQFRSLFTKSPVSIIIHDKDSGEILDCNPAACRILGVSSLPEIKDYKDYYNPPYSMEDYLARVKSVSQSGPQQFEWQIKKATGETIWENVNLTALEINGVLRIIATATDTTRQKQAEQDKVARQVAEEANRTKSAFLSNMSHEIRTPLNAIIGFAQILRRDITLAPRQSEQVQTILRSGEHLINLINDILDLSKIEAGHFTINEEEFSLQDMLSDLQMMFSLRAKEKKLYFAFEKDENLPAFLYSDEAKLRQIFINLIGNAFKFTSTGGITVRVHAGRANQETNDRTPLYVEVTDTGAGISEEDKERIFDPFWQAAAGKSAGGTGLGLAICMNIISIMGGRLSVDSQLGQGSNFKFFIMFKPSDKAADSKRAKPNRVIGIAPGIGPFRILVADDRNDNRVMLRELLQPLGFEVQEAANGQEVLDAFADWNPHAILTDINMPQMDGFEVIKRIRAREQGKSVLLIGLTASVFSEDMVKVTEAGANDVLNKPFRAEELFSLLAQIPGLTYIYEQDKELGKTFQEIISIRQALAELPSDMVEEMLSAVELGNMVQLRKLAVQIEKLSPMVAKELLTLAREYDYEKLTLLFEK
ncbi:MAG: PAS domain S-box protein [Eubacteriales bacterium]